jgi:hypothetical protein
MVYRGWFDVFEDDADLENPGVLRPEDPTRKDGRIRGSFGSSSMTGNEGRSCTESIVDVMKNVTRLARMSVAPLWLSAIGLERMIDKLVEEQQKTKPHGTVRTLWQ